MERRNVVRVDKSVRAAIAALCVLTGLTAAGAARACDTGTVRDAALHAQRDVHRLCYFTRGADAAAYDALAKAFEAAGAHLNIVPDKVDCNALIDWQMYGLSEPPATPFTALVGPSPYTKEPAVILQWTVPPDVAACAALRTSPLREAIKSAVIDYWAAIVYAPAAGDPAGAMHPEIQAVADVWNAQRPPGIAVLRLDRRDPAERVFCAFAGIQPDGPAWAGIVYGRGKLMAVPLQGDAITRAALNNMLKQLPTACTCLQDAVSLGVDMPMAWELEWDAKVMATASTVPAYLEESLDSAVEGPNPAAATQTLEPERHVAYSALETVGSIFAATAALTAAALIRQRRKQFKP